MIKENITEKPSILIKAALEDMRQVENMEGMRVYMREWITDCSACMAGSVIFNRYNCASLNVFNKRYMKESKSFKHKIIALDSFRRSLYTMFLSSWIGQKKAFQLEKEILKLFGVLPNYENSPTCFENRCKKIADYLEKKGL